QLLCSEFQTEPITNEQKSFFNNLWTLTSTQRHALRESTKLVVNVWKIILKPFFKMATVGHVGFVYSDTP
ncbi:MAG: hypothetical protein JAY75_20580, partial [Candidatus Thiodiazotropha taylori]|nr:hypothetical protein [Candidatus Thiodiazotropha taylori]MCW4310616.1 hypothetical protein [Candidatus Thiodiazotropha endolucinida]